MLAGGVRPRVAVSDVEANPPIGSIGQLGYPGLAGLGHIKYPRLVAALLSGIDDE